MVAPAGRPTPRRSAQPEPQSELAADLLEGAVEISRYIFGKADDRTLKRTRRLISQRNIPTFTFGTANIRFARKSQLLELLRAPEPAPETQVNAAARVEPKGEGET